MCGSTPLYEEDSYEEYGIAPMRSAKKVIPIVYVVAILAVTAVTAVGAAAGAVPAQK